MRTLLDRVRAADAMRLRAWLMALAFLAVSGAVALQTAMRVDDPGHPTRAYVSMQDFRAVIYYPALSMVAGRNPYQPHDDPDAYPAGRGAPLYLPMNFGLQLPFGLLARHQAEAVYFLLNLALVPAIAYFGLRLCRLAPSPAAVLGIAALIVLSRPGQFALFAGQNTIQVVVGTYVALLFAPTRPWLAGVGLAAACLKPTFGLPLGFLLLWRREIHAFVVGSSIVAALCAVSAMVLARLAGGFGPLLASIGNSPESRFFRPDVSPILSPYRLDAASFLGRLIGWPPGMPQELVVTAVVLGLASWACWRVAISEREPAGAFSASLVCLALLTCMYHQTYDALVVAAPMIALVTGQWQPPAQPAPPATRWILFALLAIPAVNFLNTSPGLRLVGDATVARRVADIANSAALLAALLIYFGLVVRRGRAVAPSGGIRVGTR